MSKKLLIVESPAKAKTIGKYLGEEFIVKSSFGHIRDLDKGKKGVDIADDFNPNYVVSEDKNRVVKELKEAMKSSDEVWLATDEDREGEAISWHLCKVLNLDERKTKRIVFREITKPAIQNAVLHPRLLDLNLVDAQQARRVLDRLVGYELSEILWRKIKSNLSAGRVQSVAVKLVVEREREIQNHNSESFFKVGAEFSVESQSGKNVKLIAESPEKITDQKGAEDWVSKCIGAKFSIKDIEVKPAKRKPSPPFTTSTLQQEASRKLGYSVNRTMANAQGLYEAGYITYMRTDSTSLSKTAMDAMAYEIEKSYGKNYVQTRHFKTKNENAQEAHEAIRPTYMDRRSVPDMTMDHQKLYDLIWKRSIASQMADAELERTIATIGISSHPLAKLVAEGEVLKFDGFLKLYIESKDEDDEDEAKGMLPPLKIGQVLPLIKMEATERFTRPTARFTEASLVKKLEELGIGRPSTYAPTISKIMEKERGYVIKDSREGVQRNYKIIKLEADKISTRTDSETTGTTKNCLYPLDMGILVVDFLDQYFKEVMNYKFTAEIEKEFDEIASGERSWTKMMGEFYFPFHEIVEKTMNEAGRASGERILGKTADGLTILVRMSRFGPVVQIGAQDEIAEGEKPRYSNLKKEQSLESISLDEAMDLFKLPRVLGRLNDEEVSVGSGRFGPFIKYGESYVSIPKGEDPLDISTERAIELIKEKQKEDAPIAHFAGKPVTRGKGRFGPFIKWNDMFINIPARYGSGTLAPGDIDTLIQAKIEKEENRFIQNFPEEKITVENGRWGPFIRFGKKMLNFPKNEEGKRMTAEEAAILPLEKIKAVILLEIPTAFDKKVKAPAKAKLPSTGTKKPAAKKPATAKTKTVKTKK
jgi:DNA topoisomerase I